MPDLTSDVDEDAEVWHVYNLNTAASEHDQHQQWPESISPSIYGDPASLGAIGLTRTGPEPTAPYSVESSLSDPSEFAELDALPRIHRAQTPGLALEGVFP
jgi:hypothetical protein